MFFTGGHDVGRGGSKHIEASRNLDGQVVSDLDRYQLVSASELNENDAAPSWCPERCGCSLGRRDRCRRG
jgi:hypothetical protein